MHCSVLYTLHNRPTHGYFTLRTTEKSRFVKHKQMILSSLKYYPRSLKNCPLLPPPPKKLYALSVVLNGRPYHRLRGKITTEGRGTGKVERGNRRGAKKLGDTKLPKASNRCRFCCRSCEMQTQQSTYISVPLSMWYQFLGGILSHTQPHSCVTPASGSNQ